MLSPVIFFSWSDETDSESSEADANEASGGENSITDINSREEFLKAARILQVIGDDINKKYIQVRRTYRTISSTEPRQVLFEAVVGTKIYRSISEIYKSGRSIVNWESK